MARPPTVWLRSQDDHYYTTLKGEKIKLSPDKKEAKRLFHELLSKHTEPIGSNISPSFKKIADLFLDESLRTKTETRYRLLKTSLQSFCDFIGAKRIVDLKPYHVHQWVALHSRPNTSGEKVKRGEQMRLRIPWNESTACSARSDVLACVNWAVNQGYIDSHPLGRVKRGAHRRRERIFTTEELVAIRETVKPDFADFLLALELTGARPFSELATLTAGMIDWKANIIPFEKHKNEKKGKGRTIYITPKLAKLLKRKCAEYPEGYLFRNRNGAAWTSHDATRRLHWATDQLKIPRGSIYAVRHHYCTTALAKGMSANLLAELVGNSPVTLSRHYDHLSKKPDVMLKAALLAVA